MSGKTPYSRGEAVSAIKSFYGFLTTLPGLLPSAIRDAPPNGWAEIDSNTLAPLKKNGAVIDLLRYIPYIDNNNSGGTVEIAYKTLALQFNKPAKNRPIDCNKLEGSYIPVGCELPEHVVALTKGGEYGSWLLLDTQEGKLLQIYIFFFTKKIYSLEDVIYKADNVGTVTDYIMMERPERDYPPLDDPENWRAYQTLPIVEFFELWKEKYRSLEWVVLPEKGHEDGVYIQQRKEIDVSTSRST